MQTVVMPKMGDTMEEGKILTWRKHEGDTVERGDALAEIETEKVNIEAESFAEGVLRKILVQAGQTVPVGTPIALVGAPSEAIPPEFVGGGDQPQAKATTPTVAARPAVPESQPGRPVYAQGQAEVAPEETAPRIVDQPVTTGPAASARAASRADSRAAMGVSVGAETAPGPNGTAASLATAAPMAATTTEAGRIFISPIARRIAQEHNLDIARIPGTGPSGRIIKEDVEAALEAQQTRQAPLVQPVQPRPAAAPTMPAAPIAPAPTPQIAAATAGEGVEAVPLTAMRRTIARRLQQSMQSAPHFYVTVAIDTTRLAELRATVNEYTEKRAEPVKISYNDLIVKGVAMALRRNPAINVSFAEDAILFKRRINIGIAVALEQGLIVPVIRDADRLSLTEIARESQRLSAAARAGTLKPEEFQGGTFTVSNLGMFGVEDFTAVINPPEAAILAVAAIVPTVVALDGQVVVRERMKVTLSVDHRAIDGATAARFLQALKQLLEEPMGLLV
jgi:pyruvate dehydrogenase E2 component (dihydrolipoamide acetyltransferase)